MSPGDRDALGADEVVRQLCWRDFFHQVTAAFPAIEAWRQGRTGVPIVDAGMRQLLAEGWMHNRARMVVASFLTKQAYRFDPTGDYVRRYVPELTEVEGKAVHEPWKLEPPPPDYPPPLVDPVPGRR